MRAAVALAAVTFAVAALTGCGGENPEAIPTPTSAPTTGNATTSPSPSATETMSAERAAAERALDRFLQVEAELYADPTADVSALDEVSYGLALSAAKDYLDQSRRQGIVEDGPTTVISRAVTENDLGDDPPTLVIEQCLDGSEVRVTQNGKPFEGTRTKRNLTTYGVSYWEGKWQVSFLELSGPDQC